MSRAPEAAAAGVLARHSTTIPVQVELIVRAEGFQIGRNGHDSDASSFAWRAGRVVGVNTRTSPRRERFATAHAFGHMLLHDRPLIVCHSIRLALEPSPCTPTLDMEDAADRFAGALLMPREPLVAALGNELKAQHDSRDALIEALARRFLVSREAMGWRLVSLNLTMA